MGTDPLLLPDHRPTRAPPQRIRVVRHKRRFRATLAVLLLAVSAGVARADAVRLVLSGAGKLYLEVADALQSGLARSSRNLRTIRVQANAYSTAGGGGPSVAVGMKACETVFKAPRARPLLCVLVPRAAFLRLTKGTKDRRVSAIYLDQPIARQLAAGRALLPDARRVGLLAGPELRRETGAIRRSARAAGFEAALEPVTSERDAATSIQHLVRDNDLILAVYDPQVLTPSTAKWLLHLSYQKGVPVVGFSQAYVKAGAVAAVFSTPEQMGRQAAEAILEWYRNGNERLAPPAYPSYFDIAVNRAVAGTLGLKPPTDQELATQVARLSRGGAP